eukprot:TRINITY_DN108537_c0_g1_i1.p1 TRINITY_DN108537_c0_g1~~TRINITY_DN108537_c0_g1_i1.p1  ORF type:complete len:405 (+),score=83.74 TRINITY_DN108537_c0_g1_i1:147-1217(+)
MPWTGDPALDRSGFEGFARKLLPDLQRGWMTPDLVFSESQEEFFWSRPLAFGGDSRELQHLGRGWTTPDPSSKALSSVDLLAVRKALTSIQEDKTGSSAETEHRHAEGADGQSLPSACVFLDWDDSILPTSWLKGKTWFAEWMLNRDQDISGLVAAEDLEVLEKVDEVATRLLLAVAPHGRIFCVTSSKPGWQAVTMKTFLPQLNGVWCQLGVEVLFCMHADVRGQESLAAAPASRQDEVTQQKHSLMTMCLKRSYVENANLSRVLSIGDGRAEAEALLALKMNERSELAHLQEAELHFYNISLLQAPTCDGLLLQLRILLLWMPGIMQLTEDLDIDMHQTEGQLMELHGKLTDGC